MTVSFVCRTRHLVPSAVPPLGPSPTSIRSRQIRLALEFIFDFRRGALLISTPRLLVRIGNKNSGLPLDCPPQSFPAWMLRRRPPAHQPAELRRRTGRGCAHPGHQPHRQVRYRAAAAMGEGTAPVPRVLDPQKDRDALERARVDVKSRLADEPITQYANWEALNLWEISRSKGVNFAPLENTRRACS